ncbi:MAG: RraA family protein [Hyphomicrobiaceae bacterium]|nr:RraA family protein [Hyphomicrobiaceae bacterium]
MIGLRIALRERTVSPALVARAKKIAVANLSDCMSRLFSAPPALRPMHDGTSMAGVAITVRARPGDNLMLHKSLDLAGPGDIIVCDGGGDLTNALIGELMLAHAAKRKISGVVIYGAIRDADAVRQASLPVFAAGVTHRGPYKDGPGEINTPISLGGVVVNPGDLVVGDADGVLVIPYADAEAVIVAGEAKQAAETKTKSEIASGTWDRAWIDASLKRLGCKYE